MKPRESVECNEKDETHEMLYYVSVCAYSTSELCFSHSPLLLTENILKWIDVYLFVHCSRICYMRCTLTFTTATLSRLSLFLSFFQPVKFFSCLPLHTQLFVKLDFPLVFAAIYIKIYALFNHELVVCVCVFFGCRLLFLRAVDIISFEWIATENKR